MADNSGTADLSLGARAEALACRHLEEQGLRLLERNYRSRFGEIDLILDHRGTVVFVEVRYRASTRYGQPAETVDPRKLERLRVTAELYLQRLRGGSKKPARFDIVALTGGLDAPEIEWIQNVL